MLVCLIFGKVNFDQLVKVILYFEYEGQRPLALGKEFQKFYCLS